VRIALQWSAIMALIVILGITLGILFNAMTTPCAAEDSLNCYWSGSTMGNGQGSSYVTISNDLIFIQLNYGK